MEWKEGSFDWVPLKGLKQSNSVELAEYAVANEISDEPAFNWWFKETLRHRDRIIYRLNLSIGSHHISFGYEFPRQYNKHMILTGNQGLTFEPMILQKR